MFSNVLVGVDGTPSGRDAIALASALLDVDGQLTLVHAYSGITKPSHALVPGMIAEDLDNARELLESERRLASVQAEVTAIDAVTVGEGLHIQAERQDADLLVLGTCHRGAVGRALLGDHTRAALNGASCAVAVAPAGFATRESTFASIGVAYDGSPEGKHALAVARDLGRSLGAHVRALHVVGIPYFEYAAVAASAGDEIGELLASAERELAALDGVEGRAVYGLPDEELAAFSGQVDLMVVGSRGYGPARRLIMGSTSNYLLRHARGPLLVLPRGATGVEEGESGRDTGAAVHV